MLRPPRADVPTSSVSGGGTQLSPRRTPTRARAQGAAEWGGGGRGGGVEYRNARFVCTPVYHRSELIRDGGRVLYGENTPAPPPPPPPPTGRFHDVIRHDIKYTHCCCGGGGTGCAAGAVRLRCGCGAQFIYQQNTAPHCRNQGIDLVGSTLFGRWLSARRIPRNGATRQHVPPNVGSGDVTLFQGRPYR